MGSANAPLAHGQPPSDREVVRMLMADTETLPEAGRTFTSNSLAQVPGLAEGIAVAKPLNLLLRHKSQESLAGVLDDAAGTLLANFAASMQRDLRVVQAAFKLPWTTSPAEGQINRIKTIKRSMYGRAGFTSSAPASCMPHEPKTTAREPQENPFSTTCVSQRHLGTQVHFRLSKSDGLQADAEPQPIHPVAPSNTFFSVQTKDCWGTLAVFHPSVTTHPGATVPIVEASLKLG